MLDLPDVTLVLIETREHQLAKLALEDCERQAEFGDIVVFTDKPALFEQDGRQIVEVPDWPTKEGWSKCFWYEVPKYIATSHVLGIQWDSWIVDPSMWRDEYLEWDYIGSPWGYRDGLNVGNGGFCLRSTKLLRFVRAHRNQFPCEGHVDDDLYCRRHRPGLMDAGFEWAPEPLAFDFAFECVRPDPSARHFGFHAAFNFDYGCQGDDERLLQRASLMERSDYIRNNGYMWRNFAERCPHIIERLHAKENGNG